jgi:hypothetical protein
LRPFRARGNYISTFLTNYAPSGLGEFAHQYFYQITPPSGLGEFAHQYFYQITPPSGLGDVCPSIFLSNYAPSGLEEIANQLSNYTAP